MATPTKTLKDAVCEAVDRSGEEIVAFAEDIFRHPELGFKETRTAARVQDVLRDLAVPYRSGLALTGVKGVADTGRPGPGVALMGELDSVLVPEHPLADPETGAAHACGHPMQLAAMLGAGMGLVRSGVIGDLAGRLILFAVPAEEYVEVEYRLDLVRQGKIEFLSGKPEMVRLGETADVDLALLVHSTADPADRLAAIHASSNGLVAKQVRFAGRAAHAGGAPWNGINALNAAHVALAAIHAQRETFRDEDSVRVHPILTKGGSLVNVVPDDVRLETYARGKTAEAIRDASGKVDRALRAGAVAVGCRVRIQTVPGYLPLRNDPSLGVLFKANMLQFIAADDFVEGGHFGASTDMGDISHLLPALHPMIGGGRGALHGADYAVADPVHSYLHSAKALAMSVVDLLTEDAREARRIVAGFRPKMTVADYLAYLRALSVVEEFDGASVGRGEGSCVR